MMLMLLNAVIPDVDPLPLPSPPWLLWFLLMLTFVLHVLAMNFVLGGSLITAIARLRGGEHGPRLARSFGKAMPTVIATAITFGVPPLLFVQALYGRLFFSSSVLMAWFWLSVVPALILAYYGAYVIAFREMKLGRAATAITMLVSLIFLGVAFVYSNNMTLMLHPERFLPMYVASGAGVQLNLADTTLIPRYLHMILGAIAVAGMAVALYGVAKTRTDQKHGAWAVRHGALWFVVATLLNTITGIWWLGALPTQVVVRFMGGNVLATVWLGAGIALGLVSLALMLKPTPRLVIGSAGALVLSLVAMPLARDQVRRGMFELSGFTLTTNIAPQWDVIAIFLVLLIGALGTTGWMARKVWMAAA